MIADWHKQWTTNVKVNVLAGMTATLALVPDSLAFSFMAGVPPTVGIYATICILLVTTFLGGRPGMISAAGWLNGRINADAREGAWHCVFIRGNGSDRHYSIFYGCIQARPINEICSASRFDRLR